MGKYRNPSLTTDIFIYNENKEFILIKRRNNPYKNYWALPGGFVDYGESVEDAAIRESKEETTIDVELDKLVGVYSKPNRDPRGHTISIVFTAKGNMDDKKADDDAIDIDTFTKEKIKEMKLAFDHDKIINDCLKLI